MGHFLGVEVSLSQDSVPPHIVSESGCDCGREKSGYNGP